MDLKDQGQIIKVEQNLLDESSYDSEIKVKHFPLRTYPEKTGQIKIQEVIENYLKKKQIQQLIEKAVSEAQKPKTYWTIFKELFKLATDHMISFFSSLGSLWISLIIGCLIFICISTVLHFLR